MCTSPIHPIIIHPFSRLFDLPIQLSWQRQEAADLQLRAVRALRRRRRTSKVRLVINITPDIRRHACRLVQRPTLIRRVRVKIRVRAERAGRAAERCPVKTDGKELAERPGYTGGGGLLLACESERGDGVEALVDVAEGCLCVQGAWTTRSTRGTKRQNCVDGRGWVTYHPGPEGRPWRRGSWGRCA